MSSSVVFPSSFDASKISISDPRQLTSGAKQAYLNYGGERLIMQTAVNMSVPFGLNVADKFGPPQYGIELSFRNSEQRPEIKQFMDVMKQIDDKLIEEGVKKCKTWFKSDLSREVVKAFYNPCVRYSKDKDGNINTYPPNLKLKLRKINNDFETKFYDASGTPYKGIPIEDLLVKNVQVTAIIECAGVWFAGSKYGLTWRAKQVAIHKLPEKLQDFAFAGLGTKPPVQDIEDEEENNGESNQIDDDEAFVAPKQSVISAVMPKAKPVEPVEESPIDDEDGDDIEPAPVPKKTVIKKKVIAKK